jgi:hypothetical protein
MGVGNREGRGRGCGCVWVCVCVCLSSCPPPGNSGPDSTIPARPSRAAREGLGTARFTKPPELKERRSARCPRVAALVQLHPPNHRPGQLAARIALCITWGGLVGGRGHRKGQLRVLGILGSPQPFCARHTKEPRTGGPPGGRGVRGPVFFCESPFVHTRGY